MAKKITVEICCGSADDVFTAKQAGAHRVELNCALFLGGLTPSIGEMHIARQAGIDILAMVRPRSGGFCYTNKEFETMLADAEALLQAGAAGIVFGILLPDGTVDMPRCQKMLEVIGPHQSVFHRAIDVVPDWRAALDSLCELGFDRVLTSGQRPSVRDGIETVRSMVEYAAGRIEILPGAGIRLENVLQIVKQTGCNQVHAAFGTTARDSSSAAVPDIHFGGALYPPEDGYPTTNGVQVEKLVRLLE